MNSLKIDQKQGEFTRIILNDMEIGGVIEYNLKSTENGLVELSLKLLICEGLELGFNQ